jgi:hypothetical protein
LFFIFSPQIATADSAEHPQSVAVQLANEISQFQQLSNNGVQTDETSNRIITTSDLISWSLQIAGGMEFLASKKVTDGICFSNNAIKLSISHFPINRFCTVI